MAACPDGLMLETSRRSEGPLSRGLLRGEGILTRDSLSSRRGKGRGAAAARVQRKNNSDDSVMRAKRAAKIERVTKLILTLVM
jgi:hypothetical protein